MNETLLSLFLSQNENVMDFTPKPCMVIRAYCGLVCIRKDDREGLDPFLRINFPENPRAAVVIKEFILVALGAFKAV